MQKKQQLIVSGNNGDTSINFGSFYVDEMESKSDKMLSLSAVDGVGLMDNTTFMGGLYSNYPVGDLVEDIMNSAGFGYTLDSLLAQKAVTGYIPICTSREALQNVVFAIGGFVNTSRSGTVNIKSLPNLQNNSSVTITKDRKFTGTTVKLRSLVTGVDINYHEYSLKSTKEDIVTTNVSIGDNIITFSEPVANVSVNLGTLKESGTNYCIVSSTAAGECKVSGYKYEDSTKTESVRSEIPAGEKESITTVDCTLIETNGVSSMTQRLLNISQNRIEQDLSMILESEKSGDLVNIETDYETYRGAVVESLDMDLTGGFVTKAVVIGE